MRNIFKGGPLDGNVIMTEILIDGGGFTRTLPIEEYDGDHPAEEQEDGIMARVWNWTGAGHLSPDDDKTIPRRGGKTVEEDDVAAPAPKPRPTATSSGKPKVAATTNDLRGRREAIKASRGDVSELCGLTVGKVARIEMKGGTEAEVASVSDALTKLESRGQA